jgi:uncharacterized membrane protein (UPF0136 family)
MLELLNNSIGILIVIGGAIGLMKKGSKHSIISASIIGGIYFYSSYLL